ncbi:type I-E CRISPR-associated protein Cse2/CasB [Actinoalloteichus caeruleus]|uniref:type I-E CRISPR-associated protein Cse2/CasB n=1 Tax=Actinoalloteichus cyanogriseus TaxID=2893586 RepID=UPI003AACE3FB
MRTESTVDKRAEFVTRLYRLHDGLESEVPARVSEARRTLAVLRRSLRDQAQEAHAHEFVFPHEPPRSEEDVWVLVAGLFALHNQPLRRGQQRRSLGAAMRTARGENGAGVDRRFRQLLAVEGDVLRHHLRQALTLLRSERIPVDYHQLLDDLVVLLDERDRSDDQRRRVRLRWSREYHEKPAKADDTTADATQHEPVETS